MSMLTNGVQVIHHHFIVGNCLTKNYLSTY